MIPGLLVAAALGGQPESPGARADAHKDALARFGVAVLNARRDRLLTAAKQLEAVARQEPGSNAAKRELIRVYTQIGREPDAIRLAREVLKADPQDVDTAHTLAKLLFDAGELKEAVAAAKLAAEAAIPADRADKAVAVYRDLVTLCEKANDSAAAEGALRKAVGWLNDNRKAAVASGALTPREIDAAVADYLERLGKAQAKQRKFDAAVESFEDAAKLFADRSKANDPGAAARLAWNLSGVLQAKGEPAAALEKLGAFLKLKPAATEPYVRLAQLLREAGRGDDAARELQRYAGNDKTNLPLQAVYAAELARHAASRPQADGLFAELMKQTNDPKVVEVVVRSHLETRRPREVIALLDKAFSTIRDRDERKLDKVPDTPELAAARAFAAEKARVVSDLLRDDRDGAVALFGAAAEDMRVGTKRAYGVHYFLGQLAARHREPGLAVDHFQRAIRAIEQLARNNPRHEARQTIGDAYGALINVLVLDRKPARVMEVCQEALQAIENPPHWPLAPHYFNYYLAGALAELGKEEAALAAAEDSIRQTAAGDWLTVRLQKVAVLRVLGKWDDAIAYGKKLLDEVEGKADRVRVRFALAGAYWGAKKQAEAEAELRAILEVDPDHAGACNELGFHLADTGRDLGEAERLIRRAIAADRHDRRKGGDAEPENAAFLDSLGWVLFRQGKLPEARAELERAAALHAGATDPVVWDHLGDVLFRLGEKAKAKAAWEKAVVLYEADTRPGGRGRRDGRLDEVKRKLKRVP